MSVEAISWAFELDLPPRDKFVLLALCDHYNRDERSAWMKQGTLAKRTGYNRETIIKALHTLEHEHGIIQSEPRRYADGRHASKVYRVPQLERRVGQTDTDLPPRVGRTDTDRVGPVDTDRVDQTDNMNRQLRTVNSEPTTKTMARKRAGSTFDPFKVDLPEHVNQEAWRTFAQHRREIRKKLTPTATKQLIALLEKHPRDANAMLLKAVERGWTGVFPLDAARGGTPRRAPDDFNPEKYVPTSAADLLGPSKGTHR